MKHPAKEDLKLKHKKGKLPHTSMFSNINSRQIPN